MSRICTFTISIEVPETNHTDPDPVVFTERSAQSYLDSLEELLAKDFAINDAEYELEEE